MKGNPEKLRHPWDSNPDLCNTIIAMLLDHTVQCSSEISEPKYTQKTRIRKTRKRVKKNADAHQHIRKKAH